MFLVWMGVLRYIFYYLTSTQFFFVDRLVLFAAFFIGSRFDLLVLGFLLLPTVTVFPALVLAQVRKLNLFLKIYLTGVWILILLSSAASLPHYWMRGRHFRWAADPLWVWPPVDGVLTGLLVLIFLCILGAGLKGLWQRDFLPALGSERSWKIPAGFEVALRLVLPFLLIALAARGTLSPHHLEKADSDISPWENVNELALSPLWCLTK